MGKENGLVQVASQYSVDETIRRLQGAFAEKGLQVFALIDHSGEAAKVGLQMRPIRRPCRGRKSSWINRSRPVCTISPTYPTGWPLGSRVATL